MQIKRQQSLVYGLGLLISLAWLLLPSRAHAQNQPWLADRRQRGMGIRVGDLELHPGVAGEVGFDSNYRQASGEVLTDNNGAFRIHEPVVPSLRLRVTPSLSVTTLGPVRSPQTGQMTLPPKFTFGADLALRLNQLYAVGTEFAPGSSSRTYFDGDLSLQANILPKRPWSLSANAAVSRVAQPTNDPAIPGAALSRTALNGGLDLHWRPGGGTLEWTAGYDAMYMKFDDETLALDYVDHGPNLKGRWTFLPQTALLYDGRVDFISYVSPRNQRLVDWTPMTSTLGFNGLITARLAFLVQGGWKATFFESGAARPKDYDNLIGRVEGTWFISNGQSESGVRGFSALKLGYQRDLANSGIANYYVIDRVYVDLSYAAAGVFFLTTRAGVGFVDHPSGPLRVLTSSGVSQREVREIRPDVLVSGEYRVTSTVAIVTSLAFTGSLTNNRVVLGNDSNVDPATARFDNLKFSRFIALLGARWFL